ncbi:phosphate-starvation-inducible PsiE family protein [Sphaerisporangium fuscum]|uniref:phosphate-starvation-inducible PsiE family protein n=1 Tax=Sphaerisporangium fuscum TaxID=2835868 RepID=UPI001BDC69B5|nr:phosphate-starvation-inducible PsiE family protein [Sphaerisporangium fuscum]
MEPWKTDSAANPPAEGPAVTPGGSATAARRSGLDRTLMGILARAERMLLYLVSLMLLALGAAVIVVMCVNVARSPGPWTGTTVTVIEELLLVLIILEIFVTVLAHLEGGPLRLEPFIIVGVIAVVRHILSVAVRLAAGMSQAESRARWTELAVYAGATFLLVAALAIARWSRRMAGREEP